MTRWLASARSESRSETAALADDDRAAAEILATAAPRSWPTSRPASSPDRTVCCTAERSRAPRSLSKPRSWNSSNTTTPMRSRKGSPCSICNEVPGVTTRRAGSPTRDIGRSERGSRPRSPTRLRVGGDAPGRSPGANPARLQHHDLLRPGEPHRPSRRHAGRSCPRWPCKPRNRNGPAPRQLGQDVVDGSGSRVISYFEHGPDRRESAGGLPIILVQQRRQDRAVVTRRLRPRARRLDERSGASALIGVGDERVGRDRQPLKQLLDPPSAIALALGSRGK